MQGATIYLPSPYPSLSAQAPKSYHLYSIGKSERVWPTRILANIQQNGNVNRGITSFSFPPSYTESHLTPYIHFSLFHGWHLEFGLQIHKIYICGEKEREKLMYSTSSRKHLTKKHSGNSINL